MARITAIAKNEYSTCEASINVVEPEITDGYWVNEKGEKITSAYCEDKAFFRIITSSTKPKTKVGIVLYGSQFGPDTIISYYSSKKEVKQTNSRSGLINSNNYCDIPVALNAVRGYSAYSNNEIELYCECYFIDNNRNRIELPKDKSKHLRVSHLVGYIKADDNRIRFRKCPSLGNSAIPTQYSLYDGELELVIDNFNVVSRQGWKVMSGDMKNWKPGEHGVSPVVIQFQINQSLAEYMIIKRSDPKFTMKDYETKVKLVNINNKNNDPNYNSTKIYLIREFRLSRTNQRSSTISIEDRKTETYGNPNAPSSVGISRSGAATALLVVNALNTVVEYGIPYLQRKEDNLVKDHIKIAELVIDDFTYALNNKMIPDKFWNLNDFFAILNIILYGGDNNLRYNKELYEVAKSIYKNVSKLKKYE